MNPSTHLCLECRHAPRIAIAKGELYAHLPPPNVWNWFTCNESVKIVNMSVLGLGLESRNPLSENIILRLKTEQICYLIHAQICHQESTEAGFYSGVRCADDNETLRRLLAAYC